MQILRFDTIYDFLERAKLVPRQWQDGGHSHNLSFKEVLAKTESGDDTLVPHAEKLLEALTIESTEVVAASWQPSVYGAYPVVAEYLANSPTPKRHRVESEQESTPIGVWLDLTCSAGISYQKLETRGIALLALVMKLQVTRPVELYVAVGSPSNSVGVVVTINTRPLDLATTCFILCDGQFARLPMFSVIRDVSNRLVRSMIHGTEAFRREFQVPENDLIITSAMLGDMINDPLEWINSKLQMVEGSEDNG